MSKHKCPDRITYVIIYGFLLLSAFGILAYSIVIIAFNFEVFISGKLIMPMIIASVLISSILIVFFRSLPQYASSLIVLSDNIVWKCPFYKTIKLYIAECIYVGVEDSIANFKGLDKSVLGKYGRGDEFCYIYYHVSRSQPNINTRRHWQGAKMVLSNLHIPIICAKS